MRSFPLSIRAVVGYLLLAMALAACGGAATPAAVPTAAPLAASAAPPVAGAATAAPAAQPGAGACQPGAASTDTPSGKIRLVVGTGGTGGVFYPYGGGIAKVLSAKLPNAEATAEVTGGSVDNLNLIHDGKADLGLSTVDSAYDAAVGQGAYKDVGPIAACTIAVLYQSFLHVVAIDDAGIAGVSDMKGKRISVGSAGSSTEGAADRVLMAAGLDPKADITRDNLSVAESVAAMKDRKIDAFFWIGGLPTAAVTDLMATPNLKVRFIPTESYVQQMREKYGPVYTAFTLPKSAYAGLEADVPGIGIGNILVVSEKMPASLAYDILRALFDNLSDIQSVHPEAKKLSLETAATGSSIPFHPGAIKFYTERGVWKP